MLQRHPIGCLRVPSFAVETASPALSDSVATLLAPAFEDATDCLPAGAAPADGYLPMRLFYGPELRIDCEAAELQAGDRRPILARLVVER